MIKVNLVPQEILDKELQRQRLVQVGFVAGVFGLLFLGISGAHFYRSVSLARSLAESEAKYKKLEAIVQQVEALEAQAKAVKARLDVMNELDRARPFYPRFMTELLKMLPSGIWLTTLDAKASGPDQLTLNMGSQSASVDNVTTWLRVLNSTGAFTAPALGPLKFGSAGEITFTMGATYRTPGAAAPPPKKKP
ncbi:MAG: hypothetical protein A2X36_07560 [Elusimicrobia bacterium GWA2_69_24]|nr:MAG: hypothetical protein A2X36_07560 [Elusimicrobia bacterium GWA2_69_24]HBL18017.1 hypothetical protein [Elusimicrobiota bacterium]